MSEFNEFGKKLREVLDGLMNAGGGAVASSQAAERSRGEDRNVAVARRFFGEVFNQGKLEVVDEIFSKDYIGYSSASPTGPIVGPEGIKQFVTMYRTAFPDIHFTFDDVISKGDQIVVRWTTTGTHRGDLLGIAATGKQIKVTGIGIATVIDGKIGGEARPGSHSQIDMLGMLRQLEVLPDFERRNG